MLAVDNLMLCFVLDNYDDDDDEGPRIKSLTFLYS